nr:YIP1 family protein [bacterium]
MKRSIFSMMTDPRGYMRDLPKEKMGGMPLFLAWVIGMVYLLGTALAVNLGAHYSYGVIIIAAAILAIPFAYLKVYIFAFFLYWAGWLFKGKASYRALFSAAAYGMVPDFFILLAWFFFLLIFGRATFMPQA